jgi:hypothetical protein
MSLLVSKVGEAQAFNRINSTTGEAFTRVEYPVTLHPFTFSGDRLEIGWDTQVTFWTPSKEVAQVLSAHSWAAKSENIAVLDNTPLKRGELKRTEFKTKSGETREQIQFTVWAESGSDLMWTKVARPVSSAAGNLFEVFGRPQPAAAPAAGSVDISINPFG